MKKEIFIHIGPPKTGTSAVQQWLSNNQSFLNHNGIYYPHHSVDQNGVSSGNVRSLYDVREDKQLELNKERLKKIIESFNNSQFCKLLLSSEFFFRRMDELKKYIPEAKFIAYLRNPMEVKESSYNQSVKRHFQTERMPLERGKRLPYMARLIEFSQKHDSDDLQIRLYGNRFFKNGNIVSDLLSVLGVDVSVDLPIVNSSYQFEALEFKRWFNQFKLEQFQVLVDRALQGYKDGTASYSFFAPDDYLSDSLYYAELIETYAADLNTTGLNPLIEEMKRPTPKPHRDQKLEVEDFLKVCKYLQSQLGIEYYLLVKEISALPPAEDDSYFSAFVNSCDKKLKYIYLLIKLRSRCINNAKAAIRLFKRVKP